ncbi:MAG: fumarylacetoacetate hydrolase family protein, partial [Burkholderiales bacterium]|nr:fumarylacetoacetate hydrolase family protein [Burkholderiales bacterium]
MQLAIKAPPVRTLAVAGRSDRFPVNRVFCVGRNYAAHAREMGKDPEREAPFFFMKPAAAVVDAAAPTRVPYPPKTRNYHHEIELVVAIGRGGRDIPVAQALEHVYGYAVGLDMTRRDLQQQGQDKGRPWSFGKDFDQSAPCGPVTPASKLGHPSKAKLWLKVNGEFRQRSDIDQMIWSVPEQI